MGNDYDFDDQARLRGAQSSADDDATRDPGTTRVGAPCVVAKVVTGSAPAGASFCKLEVQDVTGPEVEGGPATLTATGTFLFAANFGGQAPAAGTAVIATFINYRWGFR